MGREHKPAVKIGVISLGCPKNLVDTENLLGLLISSGQAIVTDRKEAEAIIINTCGFIESAKQEAIDAILEVCDLKQNNLAKLIVMGCLAQRYKSELEEEIPEVDRFIAIDEYERLGDILSEVLGVKIINGYGKVPRVLAGKPWTAYLKIAEGCDNKCSYCAIPSIRGPMRSADEAGLVKEAGRLAAQGVKELVLIGQDTSRYGYDLDGHTHLSRLLSKLDEIDGFRWIRVLYLYPDEIPDDLIDTIRKSRHVLPYFDIPVQHGSDRILKLMHRRGNRRLILARTAEIRRRLPEAVLRTTLITGFPSESEDDHEASLSLLAEVEWDHAGVFTYSEEEGTPAREMTDDVSYELKQKRLGELMIRQQEITDRLLRKRLGRVEDVLVEGIDPLTGMYTGRSALFAPDNIDGCVRFHPVERHEAGDFVRVRYTKVAGVNLIGTEKGKDDAD